MLSQLSPEIRQYLVITGNYWAFTLTDGALRMLVVLHFHSLGYSPLDIALLFLFYEIFGVITNLVGGWLGAHWGLNRTMNIGLALQILALALLLVPASWLSVPWVMAAQALSGIAKDLNKMSAKSAIKSLVPAHAQGTLYQWVALLTGSKNTLKGVGFFMGGFLLMTLGFTGALALMALMLTFIWLLSLARLKQNLGKAKYKPKFRDIFSKSPAINLLSAARLFLFGARDVWFVVALPVFLSQSLGWNPSQTGSFLALWIIAYGLVQALAPKITRDAHNTQHSAVFWVSVLTVIPALMALGLELTAYTEEILIGGLLIFGAVFAVNSSLHSYFVVRYANEDGVSLDIGFYYMANALGRLLGTLLSGWMFQLGGQASAGLQACLWASVVMLMFAWWFSFKLPQAHQRSY
ncbi:Predicted arabinose efflux permease, MFS family [Allopseudospirillum japonicum]|uniref:Predicted arabinose efflux permease, MFS family n=1 Tax=Allopseudospirillum japonicum TaxID=64971 RepID=A0A1H6RFX6_9GAMM|nr:organoarsenical effux MFS transporter ArsJ [Allopseudospirillum japonicum]SEI54701.1 Predicted arabinose efflux permease, MFS family [Allopseudospirillum japonicum]